MHHHRSEAAFTLIEMAMVATIIGLLVGGIMGGRYMIHQAELQSVVSDFTKFQNAYQQFKTKYAGAPGDISDAQDYWPVDPNGCPTNTVYTPRQQTCNGNGDGQISMTKANPEITHAWQQLADAALIPGTYSGVPSSGSGADAHIVGNENAPAGKRNGTAYSIYSSSSVSGDTNEFDGNYGTVVLYGAETSTDISSGPALTPREAASIDTKLDDGQPATGLVYTWYSNTGCTTSSTSSPTGAAYAVSSGGTPMCNIGYKIEPVYNP